MRAESMLCTYWGLSYIGAVPYLPDPLATVKDYVTHDWAVARYPITGAETLGAQNLTNGALTSGTGWSEAGGMALTGGKAVYTHAAGTGSLTQTAANLAVALKPSTWYRYDYTVSGKAGTVSAYVVRDAYPLTLNNGLQTTYFKTGRPSGAGALVPDVVTSFVSSAGGTVTLDTLSIKEAGPVNRSEMLWALLRAAGLGKKIIFDIRLLLFKDVYATPGIPDDMAAVADAQTQVAAFFALVAGSAGASALDVVNLADEPYSRAWLLTGINTKTMKLRLEWAYGIAKRYKPATCRTMFNSLCTSFPPLMDGSPRPGSYEDKIFRMPEDGYDIVGVASYDLTAPSGRWQDGTHAEMVGKWDGLFDQLKGHMRADQTILMIPDMMKVYYPSAGGYLETDQQLADDLQTYLTLAESDPRVCGVAPYLYASYSEASPPLPAVTSITRNGSTATITFASAHGVASLNVGIQVSGATQPEYNINPIPGGSGTLGVHHAIVSATQISYPISGSPASPATGTITARIAPKYTYGAKDLPITQELFRAWAQAHGGDLDMTLVIPYVLNFVTPGGEAYPDVGGYYPVLSIYNASTASQTITIRAVPSPSGAYIEWTQAIAARAMYSGSLRTIGPATLDTLLAANQVLSLELSGTGRFSASVVHFNNGGDHFKYEAVGQMV